MAQVQTGYELHALETDFVVGDDPEEHEDLMEEFIVAAEAIVDITSAQDVVNKVLVCVMNVFVFIFCSGGDTYRIDFYIFEDLYFLN